MSRKTYRSGSLAAALLCTLLLAACSSSEGNEVGSVEFSATVSQALSSQEVARVDVVVSGPGIPAPMSFSLGKSEGTWRGTLENIPVGTERTFDLAASDAAGTVLYRGRQGGVSIAARQTTLVAVVLQQERAPTPFENAAPEIHLLTASASQVEPGGTLQLTAGARDPDGDALTYAWSATGGSFGAPGSASSSWTAPTTEGTQQLSLQVTDARGASASLAVGIRVGRRTNGAGTADVTVSFNTWPVVTTMTALPSRLAAGQATDLTASAVDADGDGLRYAWSADCAGDFATASSAAARFTLVSEPVSGQCTFTVAVTDGRSGSTSGHLTLRTGAGAQVDFAPEVDSTFQSATSTTSGSAVVLALSAHDPEGTAVSFAWSADVGSVRVRTGSATSSEVEWLAPECFDAPAHLVATVTDAGGLATSQAFTIGATGDTLCALKRVQGRRVLQHVLADGTTVDVPQDLSAADIGAWVPREDGTGSDYVAGVGRADGTFTIEGVARTPYLLRFGASYFQLSNRTVDLGYALLGRPDVTVAPTGTQMRLALTGLTPWTSDDDLELSMPELGMGYFSAVCATSSIVPELEGATTVDATFDYAASITNCTGRPAPLPAPGDAVYVTQLSARPVRSGGVTLQEVRQAAQAGVTRAADGSTLLLSTALQPLATRPYTFDLRGATFEAFAAQAHPSAQLSIIPTNLDLAVAPNTPEFVGGALPDLGFINANVTGLGDLVETLEVANPYPSTWKPTLFAGATASMRVGLPRSDGSIATRTVFASILTREAPDLSAGSTPVVQPSVSPVRNVTLGGVAADTSRTGVGTTPVVAWTAPAVGTPNRYTVRIYRFMLVDDAYVVRSTVASLFTEATSLRLPEGLLVPGGTYVLQITAEWRPGFGPAAPMRMGALQHYAQALTSSFTP